jgi:hypothetical protein
LAVARQRDGTLSAGPMCRSRRDQGARQPGDAVRENC